MEVNLHPSSFILDYGVSMDHLGYLCAAYTVIWVIILGYFIGLSRRERRVWEELRTIREKLDKGE